MTKKWAKYKDEILKLYLEQSKPLHQVRAIMVEKYGFDASTRAYRSRFDKWGIAKYKVQRRRDSTTTEASSMSSPRSDDLYSHPPFSTGAHPPPIARLYSSPELSNFASDDLVRMDNSRYALPPNSRPPQVIYMPLDTEMHSPTESVSPASPVNTFPHLMLPYSSVLGHGYENGHGGGSNIHPALHLGNAGDEESQLAPWRPDPSNFSYNCGSQLHDHLRTPSWWLNPSIVPMIRDELDYANVNIQNALGETPMRVLFNSFQAPIHPVQVEVLLHLLESPSFDMRYHPPNSYSPLGVTVERALDSRHVLIENEDMATTLCKCLCKLLDLEANPDIIVLGQSIAHHFFQRPDSLMSYTAFWSFLEALVRTITPTIPDVFGNTVLHCALTSRDAGRNTGASALARLRSAITVLLKRTAGHGALERRNARGRTALQLLVDHWRADDEFWSMSRDFVRAGVATQDIVPKHFARDLHELASSKRGARADQLQRHLRGDIPLSVVIWLSACAQRTNEAWGEHLWALESCPDGSELNTRLLESLWRGH